MIATEQAARATLAEVDPQIQALHEEADELRGHAGQITQELHEIAQELAPLEARKREAEAVLADVSGVDDRQLELFA